MSQVEKMQNNENVVLSKKQILQAVEEEINNNYSKKFYVSDPDKEHNTFIWIGDKQHLIGSYPYHYEILVGNSRGHDGKHAFVELHIGEQKTAKIADYFRDAVKKIEKNPEINGFNWTGPSINSLRLEKGKKGHEFTEKNLTKVLIEELVELDSIVGPLMREKISEYERSERIKNLIEEYKKFFHKDKKVAFHDEVYKWELLNQYKDKKGLELVNAVRNSDNLIYPADGSTLKTLSEKVPTELLKVINKLLDENKDIIKRLADFKRDMKTLVQQNLNSKNYAEDERTASDYLTYTYYERYTFYTFEIYNSFCKYLGINTKKTGEIYPHYCELLHELEDFVSKDDELLEMIANETSNYFQSNLLLAQNIVYVMLKEGNFYKQNGGDSMTDKLNEYKNLLLNTHNVILHGAPGTGKTHLARDIADAMGAEVGFVQFHPSYDYTDFVEGLRPVNAGNDGQIGFCRKDGMFKKFCERALQNINGFSEDNFDEVYQKLVDRVEGSEESESPYILQTLTYKKDFALKINTLQNFYAVPQTETKTHMPITKDNIRTYLRTGEISDWKPYLTAIGQHLIDDFGYKKNDAIENKKPFVFIIDEVNRGEMSKIFGELFFAIEPSYRGAEKCKDLRTQYANLQTKQNSFDAVLGIKDSDNFGHFFIPENVYIIGTMNDIDRNVESMDFAFRRRFTFKEITAIDTQKEILCGENGLSDDIQDEVINRMDSLNNAIWNDKNKTGIDGLSSAYHIGGAYFLKLKDLNNDFAQLWDCHLEGLLREYLRGMEDSETKLEDLKKAYNLEA